MARRLVRRGGRGRRGGAARRPVERKAELSHAQAPPLSATPPLVMRKCACGSGASRGLDDHCTKCRGKRIQRKPATAPTHGFDMTRVGITAPNDRSEAEADSMASHVVRGDAGTPPKLSPAPAQADRQQESAGLIVEDETELVTSGQLRKTDFIAELRAAMRVTDTRVLPQLDKWLRDYERRDANELERAIRKLAPASRAVATARAYIPIIAERIEHGDIPPELAMGGGIGGLVGGLGSMIGGAARAIGGLFRKSDTATSSSVDRGSISDQLGAGTPLEAGVRGRMEDAFGQGFGDVRVHADPRAATLSRDLDAQAFTVGTHVAFSDGEYRPGTLGGDALLAHELAHVVQQRGGTNERGGAEPGREHEDDADRAAIDAMAHAHGASTRRGDLVQRRSGVGVQRCGGTHRKDYMQGTHLPDAKTQKNLLGDLGVRPPGPLKTAADAAKQPATDASAQTQNNERQWDGIEQQGIDAKTAAANRAALAKDLRDQLDLNAPTKLPRPKTVPLTDFEAPCQTGKEEVDAYYKGWISDSSRSFTFTATGPNANIKSSYDQFNGRTDEDVATDRIAKILDSTDAGQELAQSHFFNHTRTPEETAFFNQLVAEFLKDKDLVARLASLSRFGGYNRPFPNHRGLFIANDDSSPAMRWQYVGICAHEYIHTLAHPNFTRATMRAGSDVKLEGFTHMFTREVMRHMLERVEKDPDLRTKVQGDDSKADTSSLVALLDGRYGGVTQRAEDMRSIAGSPPATGCNSSRAPGGINAVRAAYFLGHVELIGLAPDGKPGPTAANPNEVHVPDGITGVDALAVASGVPVKEILERNPALKTSPTLVAGQVVILPGCRSHLVIADNPAVRPPKAESKERIAALNGVAPEDLDRANPKLIGAWDTLAVGQTVLIPKH